MCRIVFHWSRQTVVPFDRAESRCRAIEFRRLIRNGTVYLIVLCQPLVISLVGLKWHVVRVCVMRFERDADVLRPSVVFAKIINSFIG